MNSEKFATAMIQNRLHFQPIQGRALDIIDAILQAEEVASLGDALGCVRLVVEELVMNIVDYAYQEVTDGNAARADLKEKMESVLGEGTEWYVNTFWNGDNGTVVELGGTDTACNILYGINVPQE